MFLSIYLIETMQENARMRQEIQQTEKLEVLGELAASIAHEIRNPMTAARGFLQLLKDPIHNEKRHWYVTTAIEELNRAEAIINDYLSLAKPQIEKAEVASIREPIQVCGNCDDLVCIDKKCGIEDDRR
ncbi:histidine kinase dimerization/phospho-acceptor domain-containing protein [Effusibacillus consociatus]|uniref:histidine kinase n=2 Tax=Effusibacillus consociatus TaxID=1117041 RepID=A0ABV9Q0M5_9BACL